MVLFAWKKRAVNFRERIGQLKALERMEDVNRAKLSQESFIMILLIALCLVLLISPIINGYMKGVFANLMLTAVFALSLFLLRTTKKHILPWFVLIIGACVVFCIVFLNEVGELGSLDAYWLWFFIMPIMTMHFCGTWYGAFFCIPPVAITIIFMWTPVRNMYLDYGANILTWFPLLLIIDVFIAGALQYLDSIVKFREMALDQENALVQREHLMRVEEQLSLYEQNNETISWLRHDMRHYNIALDAFLQNGDIRSAHELVKEHLIDEGQVIPTEYCDNRLVNSMIATYRGRAERHGSKMKIKAVVPEALSVRNIDLASVVGNILENAVEAVLKLPKGEGKIEGEIIAQDGKFKMMVTNDCDTEPYFDDDGLPYNEAENNITSPANASSLHIGTWRVREIAVDYGGWAGYSYEKNRFTAKIVMHIKEETEK